MDEQAVHDLLVRLDERTLRMDRALFGNGQPGLLAKVADNSARLDTFDAIYAASQIAEGPIMQEYGALKDKVAKLEASRVSKTKQGALVGAGGSLGALLAFLLPLIQELLKNA